MFQTLRLAVLAISVSLICSACGGSGSENDGMEVAPADTSVLSDTTVEAGRAAAPSEKINLNTATREDFLAIPGVGDRMVGEFLEYRPYVSIQQFRREIGKYVDEAQVAAYEEHVFVPIDPNESDAETLLQIPGLDESEANSLIEGRPYDSPDAFLEELRSYVSADELAAAEAYLAQ